jgi:hypothetical protein
MRTKEYHFHVPETHLPVEKAWSERRMVRGKRRRTGRNVKIENSISLVTGSVNLWLFDDLRSSNSDVKPFHKAKKSGNNCSDAIKVSCNHVILYFTRLIG